MALRITGSVIGEPITSSSSSATGMWLSQEVAALQRDGIWQIAPGFTLTSSAATVNEGASITITLTTTGILNGTAVPYVISGANIFANDSANGVITGNFVIQNNSNTISFAANADLLTEGSEAFTITAGGASTSVTINDTSLTPDPTDAQFPYTTLALHGNGTNNSQNNTFLDSSTNNFSITRNGNSTQGTFSPYGGNWSTFIGYGAYGYQSLPAKTVYDITGADFTIEFWANFSTWNTMASSGMVVLGNYVSTNGWYLSWNGGVGANLSFSTYNADAAVATIVSTGITAGTNFQLGTWNHFTVMQKTNVIYFYLNGVMTYSTAAPAAVGVGQTMYVGVYAQNFSYAGNPYFYYSNLRILKGTGLYSTAGFTPSTTPLTAVANTTLLIGQSSNLVDNSGINATITNTVSGTAPSVQRFNPFSPVITTPTSYSAYFDGTGDNLSLAANASLALGTGDFTIEMWVYNQSTTNRLISYATFGSPILYLNTSNFLLYENYGTGVILTSSIAVPLNTWTHIAVSRASAFTRVFINGVLGASGADTNNWGQNGIYIGTDLATTYMTGSISNLRVVKGTGVYTETFTPSTTPLTAIANTQLLTCQSPTFIDNSTNTFAITAVGNSKPTTVNPFGVTNTSSEYSTTTFGGSGYFDGTGDSLTISSSSAFAYGTGAFTVEFWVYSIGTAAAQVWVINSGLTLNIQRSTGGFYNVYDGTDRVSSTAVIPNIWNHVAVVRTGTGTNQTNLYVNGVSVLNWTNTVNYAADNFAISGSASFPCTCYISNLRVVKGTAVYTSNFAPPIAPVTAVANTTMLLNFTNAGIIDNAMMVNLETVGDAKISTTQSKFGGTSMYFDGTGDYLYVPSNINNALGTGDFTLECWVNATLTPSDVGIFESRTNGIGATANGFTLTAFSSSVIRIYSNGVLISSTGTTYVGTWCHVAVVRSSGIWNLYINGVSQGTNSASRNLTNTDAVIGAGRYAGDSTPNAFFPGYIDDLRVTKGYARYTSTFTPPTQFANK
jgi:hypothetical protein